MPAPGAGHGGRCAYRPHCRRIHRRKIYRRREDILSFPFTAWKENKIADPEAFSCPVSSAKPRAMNRTGLFIALALAAVIGLVFGIHPELDLKLTGLFYDPATKSFPLKFNTLAVIARDVAMWISWGLVLPAIIALVVKLVRPDRPLLMSGRAMVFLLVTLALSAGVLTNFTFKSYWGRPRPVMVAQFNGPQEFVPWWDPRGACGRNCSFFSGEGATAFWTYAPAALTPPPWRPLAYVAATLFGVTTSLLRIAFGGHFFTDVATAGLVTFLVIWLAYRYIYRWPSTRLTDEGIDAALTRLGTRFRKPK
jgi:lipid A 4'-phosphatase